MSVLNHITVTRERDDVAARTYYNGKVTVAGCLVAHRWEFPPSEEEVQSRLREFIAAEMYREPREILNQLQAVLTREMQYNTKIIELMCELDRSMR